VARVVVVHPPVDGHPVAAALRGVDVVGSGTAVPERRHPLDEAVSELVGRSAELEVVLASLRDRQTGLLTLTGVAGVGKSAMAAAVVRHHEAPVPERRWWVGLAAVPAEDLVLETVAAEVSPIARPGRSTLEQLSDVVGDGPALLVLDNCEHVLEACAALAAQLLASCPRLLLLATSQEPLDVPDEVVVPVPPLPLPSAVADDTLAELGMVPSVALFVQRARIADPSFTLTDATAAVVTRICTRLGGIPLAIELVAAQLATMPVEEAEARLGASEPTSDRRATDRDGDRHRTLRTTLDWSHDRLSCLEARVFRRLSVFAGGWTLPAALEVCHEDGRTEAEFRAAHRRLERCSLVQPLPTGRYRLLEPIQQYALTRLEDAGELQLVRGRFIDHVRSLVERELPARAWTKPPDLTALARLEEEHANLLTAIQEAEQRADIEGALAITSRLWSYWRVRGRIVEARSLLERLLARPEPVSAEVQAGALVAASSFAQTAGDYDVAERYAGRALAACRDLGDGFGLGTSLALLANLASGRGDHERGIRLYREALALARSLGEPYGEALVLTNLALALTADGQTAEAQHSLEEALELLVSSGDRWFRAYVLSCLGRLVRQDGDLRRVHGLAIESAELLIDHGGGPELAESVEFLASLAAEVGDVATGVQLHAAAGAARQRSGSPLSPAAQTTRDAELRELRNLLNEDTFERAWQVGSRLSLTEAVAVARAIPSHQPRSTRTPSDGTWPLTQREFEVALRVAAGRTNREIGTDLHISTGTARTHVQHALRKLGFHTRAELAAWATLRHTDR
jgi:predicted ATPase/DNA-binding CsgD family transcriptional regulator